MRVRLCHGYYHGSMEGVTTPMQAEEERDVPEATGRYLLATFGNKFVEVVAGAPLEAPSVIPAVVASPPVDRALKSPPKRK